MKSTPIETPARHSGWEVALSETMAEHQALPFAYGTSDCLIQIADADKAMTGRDPMAGLRGTYSDAKGALALIKNQGFANIEAVLAARYDEVAPAMARRGDCGLVEIETSGKTEYAAVIVLGNMVMGKSPPAEGGATGATFLPRDRLVKAYKIGA